MAMQHSAAAAARIALPPPPQSDRRSISDAAAVPAALRRRTAGGGGQRRQSSSDLAIGGGGGGGGGCGFRHFRWCVAASASASSAASGTRVREDYETVIGVETHIQLATRSKAFCACSTEYGAEPNSQICHICMGYPGTLPVLSVEAVRCAIKLGMALGCQIQRVSKFDRKHYFYPDLPKGYQISQFDVPMCMDGGLVLDIPDEFGGGQIKVGITRAHLEEDAGKSSHDAAQGYSFVDFNRAGVPLVEVVSEPDMRTGRQAAEFAAEMRRIVRALGVSDGNMQDGSLRCDVNVSVRLQGVETLGTRVEIKNLNSFAAIARAVDFEVERQIEALESGGSIAKETRLWDEGLGVTKSMRDKEDSADYRYLPEPDLPLLKLSEEMVAQVESSLPELPASRRKRLQETPFSLKRADALMLADDSELCQFFLDAVDIADGQTPAQTISNWLLSDTMSLLKSEKLRVDESELTPGGLAELVLLVEDGTISGKIAKELLPEVVLKGESAKSLVSDRGLTQISDPAALTEAIARVIAANPKQREQYLAGKTKMKGFFMGQVMKETGGKADPKLCNDLLMKALAELQATE